MGGGCYPISLEFFHPIPESFYLLQPDLRLKTPTRLKYSSLVNHLPHKHTVRLHNTTKKSIFPSNVNP